MVSTEEIVRAFDILSDFSEINVGDLLPHMGKLLGVVYNLLRVLNKARTFSQDSRSTHARCGLSLIVQPAASPLTARETLATPYHTVNSAPSAIARPATPPSTAGETSTAIDQNVNSAQSAIIPQQILFSEKPERSELSDPFYTPRRLLERLQKSKGKIEKYLSGLHVDIKDWNWTAEDPRIVDLSVNSKQTAESLGMKLRKCLSRRSLVIEYDTWEKNHYYTSKLEDLSQHPNKADERSEGHVSEFVQFKVEAGQFINGQVAMNGIKQGMKENAFGNYFGHRGIIIILALNARLFREIKYGQFPILRDLLRETAWITVAEEKSASLDKCQDDHNSLSLPYTILTATHKPSENYFNFRKRLHTSDNETRSRKRHNSFFSGDPNLNRPNVTHTSQPVEIGTTDEGSSDFLQPDDIPRSDTPNAWAAAVEQMVHSEDLSHYPMVDIPRPEAPDAWATVERMAHMEQPRVLPRASDIEAVTADTPALERSPLFLPLGNNTNNKEAGAS